MLSQDTEPVSDEKISGEFDEDSVDAARTEFSYAHSLTVGEVETQHISSLVEKIGAAPSCNFEISPYSLYNSDRWILNRQPNISEQSILFNSTLAGGNDLKKMLTYHLIPQFHPLGRIKSFFTTTTYAVGFSLLEQFLFRPNKIDATPESIMIISARHLNDAFDRARDSPASRNYLLLFFIVRFWIFLSTNSLIPTAYCLDVASRFVDTKERQNDIQAVIAERHQGWEPLAQDELCSLIEYALFWIEKGLPHLIEISNFIMEHKNPDDKHDWFRTSKPWNEFETVVGKKIDGVQICGYSRQATTQKIRSSNGKIIEYPFLRYTWLRPFKQAVDKVKNAILIFMALIVGLRKRELSMLCFDDVAMKANGDWTLNVTRFKTTTDPAFHGYSEDLPLPVFVAQAIQDFRILRAFKGNMRGGRLFEQISNSKKTNLLDRSIGAAFASIRDELGIERLHPHRLRKTIAEILINRSERNIDLIRLLFGHKSYVMTLRYIARNPYLVQSITEALETNYTEAFLEIVAGVRRGSFSGPAAERIASITSSTSGSGLFKGKIFRISVFNYISHLLQAGEPIFIKRIGLGRYCVNDGSRYIGERLPCLGSHQSINDNCSPDTQNCSLICKNLVVLQDAKEFLEKNIKFYSNLMTQHDDKLTYSVKKALTEKIAASTKHISELSLDRDMQHRQEA